ncbi:hypothetical protein chiPu_0019294 [Chiloscyllium punctatum]|uniref:Ig-like domain-containing protein n=1 Tax=Chiloscyllium punctatum TaxID=137246 RepID=A0A401RRG3_CHIPU|nr:hypothetical protein [Chiloscyllium punctatum]
MFMTLHLLWALLIHVTGTLADPVLNQSPVSDPVSAGQTIQLKCAMQNDDVDSYDVDWYRQSPGEAPVWVITHDTDDDIYRGTGFTNRFQPSRDTSNNNFILTIENLVSSDSAVYYCAVWDSSAGYHSEAGQYNNSQCKTAQIYKSIEPSFAKGMSALPAVSFCTISFAAQIKFELFLLDLQRCWTLDQTLCCGTALAVRSSDDQKPSVLLLPPSPEQIDTGSATLSCLVSRFKPGFVQVLWSVDGKETDSGVTTSPVSRDNDQSYSLSSYLTVPATDWKKGSRYSCSVRHGSLNSPLLNTISSSDC